MSTLKVNKIQDTTGDDALTFDSSGNTTVNQTLTTTSANITTGGTHSLTISDGNLVIGTSGHGIDFSATSDGTTMSSELLDDYEEGTFTAVCNNSVTLDSGNDILSYTKIGRLVTVRGQIAINSSNSNSQFNITNMPFPNENTNEGSDVTIGSVRLWSIDLDSDAKSPVCMMSGTGSNLQFYVNRDNAGAAAMTATDGGYVAVTITYQTSA